MNQSEGGIVLRDTLPAVPTVKNNTSRCASTNGISRRNGWASNPTVFLRGCVKNQGNQTAASFLKGEKCHTRTALLQVSEYRSFMEQGFASVTSQRSFGFSFGDKWREFAFLYSHALLLAHRTTRNPQLAQALTLSLTETDSRKTEIQLHQRDSIPFDCLNLEISKF